MDATMNMGILNELSEYITLRMSSFLEYSPAGDWIEHKAHADYDLWFVEDGIVKLTVDGAEHTAHPGDVVFFYPGIPYRAATTPEGCRFIYVHFEIGIGRQQRILSDFPLAGVVPDELIREEAALFERSYRQIQQAGSMAGNRLYLKACLTAVVAKIIGLHGQGRYTGTFASGSKTKRAERSLDVLQPVFTHINEHLHQTMKMSELASLAGISEKYFISYFKKALGITPGQYIYQIKMNRARDFIYKKKYTVQQIASFLGYPDPFTFSKAFKKYYNVPPSKFE